ncbi:MAG: YceI family protein [Bacteroidota bacterium]
MKIAPKFFALIALFLIGFACNSAEKGTEVEAEEAAEVAEATVTATDYSVNTETSMISWQGYKTFDIGDEHTGKLMLSDGTLSVEDGNIVAGSFKIDMNTLENEDLAGTEGAAKLVGHLKSDDFFAVEKYPDATFEITTVEAVSSDANATHNITGNLTMRGQTKQITFPANVSIVGDELTATASEFTIDRTQWGVEYGNEGIEGLAKDKIISNDLTLKIVLNAKA